VLRPGKAPGTFVFDATLTDGTSPALASAAGDVKRLVLTADAKAPAGGVRRVSINPLHDTSLLVLLEAEDPERHTFSRLGEVGYIREGVAFAAGETYPLCIVTANSKCPRNSQRPTPGTSNVVPRAADRIRTTRIPT
jgi:hypothetical protein